MLIKLLAGLLMITTPVFAQSGTGSFAGVWHGSVAVNGQQVPVTLKVEEQGTLWKVMLGEGLDASVATATTRDGNHLIASFSYFARTLDVTLTDGTLSGSFGSISSRVPLTLKAGAVSASASVPSGLEGTWEIAVHSAKGESAWEMHITPSPDGGKAVIQRIDGDTGTLYLAPASSANSLRFSHLNASGAALYRVVPQPDGTLLVSNLLNDQQTNLVARRPADARKQNLAAPTDPTQQTTLKDPTAALRFSAPDLTGKVVSSTDPRFEGKVVIVAIGGSWCPNCHDEAPFLEHLYKQFHTRGLEIVNLSFEEADQLKDPARLRAFIARYGITYTVLLAGQPDQLNEKITQANNLNCWPTSFFVGRDGRVKEIHAGFAGPANPAEHQKLEEDVTGLVERLLAEPIPTQSAAR